MISLGKQTNLLILLRTQIKQTQKDFSHSALVVLFRFGYLFTEEEFHLSLETIAKNHIVKKKTELSTSSCKTKRVSKYGFEPLFVF